MVSPNRLPFLMAFTLRRYPSDFPKDAETTWCVILEKAEATAPIRKVLFKLTFLDRPALDRLLGDLPAHLKGGLQQEEADAIRQQFADLGARATARPDGTWRKLRMSFTTSQKNAARATEEAEQFLEELGIGPADRTALIAAFREAVGNACLHGNEHDPARTVKTRLIYDGERIRVLVRDQGTGFDPTPHLERPLTDDEFSKAAEEREKAGDIGGLGLLIIRRCSDDVSFNDTGNAIRFERKLAG